MSDVLPLCLEALSRHKLRTLLGVVGIVIGVAAVTTMLSVIEGARRQVLEQVEMLGLNNVLFRPRWVDPSTGRSPTRATRLTLDDVDRLRVLVPFADAWAPTVARFAAIGGPLGVTRASVLGVSPDYLRIMRAAPAHGRLLVALDVAREQRVCVLGSSLVRTLYGSRDPLGTIARIGADSYTVVGILEPRTNGAGGALSPRDLNQAVLVPAPRGAFLGQPALVDELWMRVPDGTSVSGLAALGAHALALLHRNEAGVDTLIPRDLLRQQLHARRTFDIVLGSIAALSLLVGGIGIMNMMLASVLERTNEIGVRRVAGATRRAIRLQFLVESVVVTVVGGLLGVAIGSFASIGVTRYAGWPVHVSTMAVSAALLASAVVGVAGGTYPAHKAAKLEPIDALRYE